jgi:hypothetical protein
MLNKIEIKKILIKWIVFYETMNNKNTISFNIMINLSSI